MMEILAIALAMTLVVWLAVKMGWVVFRRVEHGEVSSIEKAGPFVRITFGWRK